MSPGSRSCSGDTALAGSTSRGWWGRGPDTAPGRRRSRAAAPRTGDCRRAIGSPWTRSASVSSGRMPIVCPSDRPTAGPRSTTCRSCCSARPTASGSCLPATSRRASIQSSSPGACRRSTSSRLPTTAPARPAPGPSWRRSGRAWPSFRPARAIRTAIRYRRRSSASTSSRGGRTGPTPMGPSTSRSTGRRCGFERADHARVRTARPHAPNRPRGQGASRRRRLARRHPPIRRGPHSHAQLPRRRARSPPPSCARRRRGRGRPSRRSTSAHERGGRPIPRSDWLGCRSP
jgi:hypothetical protein